MATLRKGSKGPEVAKVSKKLVELGLMEEATSEFDNEMRAAVRAFQSHMNGPGKRPRPLEVDGLVGDLTKWALFNKKRNETFIDNITEHTQIPCEGGSKLGRKILEYAIAEMVRGAGESEGNNQGADVAKYHRVDPDKLTTRWAWCAAFVSWCIEQACKELGIDAPVEYSGGARHIFKLFKKLGLTYSLENDTPQPGDLVVWWRESRTSWKGHIGIVLKYEDGILYTIEGNRGGFPSRVRGYDYVGSRMKKLVGFCRVV